MNVPPLNYHHLRYFWTVAKTGSIAAAAKSLRLSQPGISTQIKYLEEALGQPLFQRAGRGLALTEAGRMALGYADEIFSTGTEMVEALRGGATAPTPKLMVGIVDVVPKLITHQLLEPALRLPKPVRVVCREDHAERLLTELANHSLDLVLSDAPVSGSFPARLFNHPLGDSPVTFFAAPALAKRLRPGFPRSLDGAPLLLPTEGSSLRRALEQWFQRNGIRPKRVAEFDDSALMKVFAEHGEGVCPGPSVTRREVQASFRLAALGTVREVTEHFYAITAERRIRHPAVVAISENARQRLFG